MKKIDQTLELNQSYRLKPYVELNTLKKNRSKKGG